MSLSTDSFLKTQRKGNVQFLLIAVLFSIALVVSNWVYSMQITMTTLEGSNAVSIGDSTAKDFVDDLLTESEGAYWTGGWPFKYYVRVEHEGLLPLSIWSLSRAFLNSIVWTLIAGVICGYLWLTRRKSSPESDAMKPRAGQIGLLDILIVMLLLGLCFGYWRLCTQRLADEKALAKEIGSQGGSCERSVVVPNIIAAFVPEMYLPILGRIVSVTLESPDDAMLKRVLALPELRRLRMGGGSYDLKHLQGLREMSYLSELRLSGRELNGSAVASIASCSQLVSLNLMRTNISTEGMQAMSEIPRLQKLNLVHTAVDVSKLQNLKWSSQLLELVIPHPGLFSPVDPNLGDEVCGKVVLRDWPKLESLTCNEFDELKNKNSVVLDIANCPSLTQIRLDLLQRFDLILDNLPELQKLSGVDSQWKTRIGNTEKISYEPWVRKLVANKTPKLTKLNLFAPDLQELRLDASVPIQLGITSEYRSTMNKSRLYAVGDGRLGGSYRERSLNYLDDIPTDRCQNWIDELGKIVGPTRVDLSWLELQDIDLSPLQASNGIRELDLSWTNISGSQLMKLEGMNSLDKLILNGSVIDAVGICRALSKMKNLRELRFKSPNVRGLNLQSLDKLEAIFLESEPRTFTSLRLVSMPNLRESFEIHGPLSRCELVDIPSVQGLSFSHPLPKTTAIRGLRDLRFFSAGGSSITDEIVNEVLNCKQLRCLTLAYAPQVSGQALAKLAELPELEYLALPGCNLSAETMKALSHCKRLTALNLDDNNLNDQAFEGFDLRSIRQFSVNHNLVSEELISKVVANPNITKLGLANVKLSSKIVEQISKSKQLAELDLSDSELDANSWKALMEHLSSRKFKLLLRNAKVNSKSVHDILAERPDLILDLTGCSDPNLDDRNDVLAQLIWKANSPVSYDREQTGVVDTWQLEDGFMQPSAWAMQMSFDKPEAIPSRFAPYTQEKVESKGNQQQFAGEIRLFPFSPKWKKR